MSLFLDNRKYSIYKYSKAEFTSKAFFNKLNSYHKYNYLMFILIICFTENVTML